MHMIHRATPQTLPVGSFVAQTDSGPVVIFLDATGALLEDLDDWTPDLARRVAAIGQGPFPRRPAREGLGHDRVGLTQPRQTCARNEGRRRGRLRHQNRRRPAAGPRVRQLPVAPSLVRRGRNSLRAVRACP